MGRAARIIMAVVLGGGIAATHAAEVIKPRIGEPLRDTAVTRGPDGTYYLTGTRAMGREWRLKADAPKYAQDRYVLSEPLQRTRPDGSPDFMDNDGVRVWSSKDLVTWKDEGLVWDLHVNPGGGFDTWRARRWAHPDRKVGEPPTRAVTSPRLLHKDGHWFIVHSMSGHDVGMMRSRGDSIGGPFQNHHKQRDGRKKDERASVGPGYGSVFVDRDGAAYKVWGPGFIVRMKEDLSDPAPDAAEHDLLTKVAGYPNTEWCARQFAPRAASLYRDGDTYLLVWSAQTDADGYKREDSFVAAAPAVLGPYGEPQTLVPGSGPAVLFDDGQGGWMVSWSMDNTPVIVPLVRAGAKLEARGLTAPRRLQPQRPGAPRMYDYATSQPSGRWHEPHPKTSRSKLTPFFDLPLADIAIARGGDAYYLTGTAASVGADGRPDFENNDGIYLWRSTDLDTWRPLGKVWDIEKDGRKSPQSAWQLEYRIPANGPTHTAFARGITAPEIRFAEGTYWIAYSMNGRGTGLLKSASGKPEGPYEDLGRLTGMGGSPSLFVAADGAFYWFWGDLRGAKLAANGAAIDGPVSSLFVSLNRGGTWHPYPHLDWWNPTGPLVFVTKGPDDKAPQHYLAWSAITQRHGRALRETLVARSLSESPMGPYDKPALMIPHGGETSVVEGSSGKLYASFYGADPMAAFRNRPCLVPVAFGTGYPSPKVVPTKVLYNFYTNRGGWEALEPAVTGAACLIDYGLTYLPDGYFYVGASHQNRGDVHGTIPLWRSRDPLAPNWERLTVLTREDVENDPDWPVNEKPLAPNDWRLGDKGKGTPWIGRLWHVGGDYILNACFTGLRNNKRMDPMLLKSASGRPEGPYRFYRDTNIESLLIDDDGAYYAIPCAAVTPIVKLDGDLRVAQRFQIRVADGTEVANDCGCALFKHDGKYLWMGLNCYGCYDQQWYASDRVDGVYRLVAGLPYTGNGNLVRGPNGRVYTSNQSGFFCIPAPGSYIYPVHVDLKAGPPVIEHEFERAAGVRQMSVY